MYDKAKEIQLIKFFDEDCRISNLELIAGSKPCSKCDKDSGEAYWDPSTFTMSWTCPDGHSNTFMVN